MGRRTEFEKAERGRPLGTRIKGMPGYAPAAVTVAPRGRRPYQMTVWRRVIPKHAERRVVGIEVAETEETTPRVTTSPYLRFDSKEDEWVLTDEAIRELIAYEAVGKDVKAVLRGLARQAILTEMGGTTEPIALTFKELEELGKGILCLVPDYPPSPEDKEIFRQRWMEMYERLLNNRKELLEYAFTEPIGVDEAGRITRGRAARYIRAVTVKRFKRALKAGVWGSQPGRLHPRFGKLYDVVRVQTKWGEGERLMVPTEEGLEFLARQFPRHLKRVKRGLEEKLEAFKTGRIIYMTPEMRWDAHAVERYLWQQLRQAKGEKAASGEKEVETGEIVAQTGGSGRTTLSNY